ncbi:MAG: TetR/AcrR family transcriptional regulator [Pseudomonadota bacterium]
MPREKTYTSAQLADRAFQHFWFEGYNASSMDDLVKATAVSRHGIYSEFGGKKNLFLACFDRYQDLIVSPAIAPVESPDATIADIAAYFETQIALAEELGLPGPGCFVANALTEMAPHDADVLARVQAHNDRLRRGFRTAIQNSARTDENFELNETTEALLTFATGLWSMSRISTDAAALMGAVASYLTTLERRLS